MNGAELVYGGYGVALGEDYAVFRRYCTQSGQAGRTEGNLWPDGQGKFRGELSDPEGDKALADLVFRRRESRFSAADGA